MIKPAISLILAFVIFSCSNKQNSSVDCVNTFIDAAREHEMTKAWNSLSPEAQAFYNDLGEKNRKSGKGILEHDIEEVIKFKNPAGYKVVADPVNSKTVFITRSTGVVYTIETVEGNGDYKIKDETSVHNIIKGIAEEIVKKDYYQ